MTPFEIVSDARAWLKTTYVHQARLRGVGSDCIGLIGGIARDRGTPEGLAWEADKDAHNYGRPPNRRRLISSTDKYLDRISVAELDVGDVVLTRVKDDPEHFAIVSQLNPPYIIHAWISAGEVCENRLDDKWRSRILRAYRYRGVE